MLKKFFFKRFKTFFLVLFVKVNSTPDWNLLLQMTHLQFA